MTLFFSTIHALLWQRPLGHPLRFDMLCISLLMFVIATMVSTRPSSLSPHNLAT